MISADTLALLDYLTPAERAEIERLITDDWPIWTPLPGPQQVAWTSTADVVGFGGAAGGGKSDLGIAKALIRHQRSMIVRRNGTELTGIVDRIAEVLGTRDGLNGKDMIWRLDGRQIEFGSCPNLGDEKKYQGRPHDLIVFDEATNFLEAQVRFLLGWLRTVTIGQRCQALLTFNPPTSAEGRWVIAFFAPWLDPKHPNPALPGELRYFAVIDGKDIEVDGPEAIRDPEGGPDIIPQSRTFIPSRVTDNPYLMGTGYMAQLQALPEPLRSQMLKGDFQAGMEDDAMQVIPTAWVQAAMDRWKPRAPKQRMESMGVDVARGGKDNTVLARRHEGNWYDELLAYPGTATPDGPMVAGISVGHLRDAAPIHIDVIGVGASPFDFLRTMVPQVIGVNVSETATRTDKSGKLNFANMRTQLWWLFREELDPANDTGIALPPDPRLLADLTAPRWTVAGRVISVESRDEIVKRIGRSPDYASAVLLASIETPRVSDFAQTNRPARPPHNPYDRIGYDVSHGSTRQHYDPYDRLK
jgi:hypothetical protein